MAFPALLLHSQNLTIRPYTGISADYLLLAGSFDGKSYFTTDNEIILVPRLSPAAGLGIMFGIAMGNGAIDFAYHISRMNYTSLEEGFSGKSTTHLIRYLGYKGYFKSFTGKKMRPYLDIDLSIAFSHFENISYSRSNINEVRSANYGGIIFGVGVGSQFSLINNLAIDLKILPEFYIGTDIRSKESKRYEIKKFNNFLLINSIGIVYFFKSK
jgi:hypothetical protein